MSSTTDYALYPCLHHLESSASLRVLWALEELQETQNLEYRLRIYPRTYNGYPTKEVSVLGKSPVLCIGPRPEQALVESRLVLQYLSDTYSKGMWEPATEEDRARDIFFQELANNSLLQKTDFVLILDMPSAVYPLGIGHLSSLLTWPMRSRFANDLAIIYQYLEDALSVAKPWFAGTGRGLADFNMIFAMDIGSQRGYFRGVKYPKLQSWLENVHALPAYRRALSKGGKNNFKTFQ